MIDSAASSSGASFAPPTLPDQVATLRHLDPAAALAFRTPLQEHPPAADTKAAAILTALGIMLTLLARYGIHLTAMLTGRGFEKFLLVALLLGFAAPGLAAIIQAFRTISPRFPAAPPSLAFFGDIARLSREQYVEKVGSISHEDALEQILIYNHTLATICVEKFRHLGKGVRFFRWAFACWLLLMVLVNLRILF
ncbi:Pycsar system effector family protein [Tundrisphaera lichenicola]|uniref:Pycsar system effector family protein n=1 Tax=Tundrisphaera lichenicola TaxID=2029860 RepID=UPI003EBDEB46